MAQQPLPSPEIGTADLARMLLSVSDVDEVLGLVARIVCARTVFTRSVIVDIDGVTGWVRGRAGHGVPLDSVVQVEGPADDFPVISLLSRETGALVSPMSELDRLFPSRYVDLFDVAGVVVAQPLRSDRLGLLGIVFCDGGGDSDFAPQMADLRALQDMSEVAALAFQHALLLRRSVALQSLRERSQIAADLHDGVTQQLYVASLDVDELRSGEGLPPEARLVLKRLALRLDSASQQLRSALAQLASGESSDSPLDRGPVGRVVDRIRGLLDDVGRVDGPSSDIDVAGDGPEPDSDRADVLVRTAREGLANVMKHARATQVEIQIRRGGSWWTVEVSDDGVGRAADVRRRVGATGSSTFGLRSLEEDVARLDGRLWISDAPRLMGLRLGVAVPVASDG